MALAILFPSIDCGEDALVRGFPRVGKALWRVLAIELSLLRTGRETTCTFRPSDEWQSERSSGLFFDVARDEGLPNRDDLVIAHTWWFTIFGLATLFVIQGVVPDLPDQALVVEQTIATLWAGVQAVPRLPKSAISKRSGRSSASKQ